MHKNNFIQNFNLFFEKFAEWVLDHRIIVLILCVILCITSAALIPRVRFDFHSMILCPDDDPATEYYKNFEEEYGNEEILYIVYEARQGVLDKNILRKTEKLVEELKNIIHVKKVHSITNLEYMRGSDDGSLVISSIMEKLPANSDESQQLKHRLLSNPLYVNTYLSRDAKYAAIMCELEEKPEDDLFYQIAIRTKLDEVLSKPDYEEFNFYPVGNTLVTATFYELNDENSMRFSSISFVLILLLLVFIFRHIKGVISPFIVIQFALLLLLGYMAINDFPITVMFAMIPGTIMAVGIADAVHIISEYQMFLREGHSNRVSILKAVKMVGFPCLFTSITTAIGFYSLSTSPISPVREMGSSLAFGTLAAFAVSITFLLVVLSFAGKNTEKKFHKLETKSNSGYMTDTLIRLAGFNIKHYRGILLFSVIATIVLIYGVTKMEVNSSALMQLGDKIQIYKDSKFIDEVMGGSGNFEILLESKEAEGIKTAKFMRTLEKIQKYVNSHDPLVKKTFSIVDVLKEVNRAIHNNNKKFYIIPAKDEDIAQALLLYEFSGGGELERFVSTDLSSARLTIFVRSDDSKVYHKFQEDLTEYIESLQLTDYSYAVTGGSYMIVRVFLSITKIMTESLSIAIILISLMMIIVFRSFKIGILSMIPNIFPVLFALGFMGLSGIWLSHATSVIGCIVIGLAVDDTIHFISRYRMEFDRLGNYEKALIATMSSVGRPLLITTVTLFIGFGVFMTSRMANFYYAGLITILCFLVALMADFFIASALILAFKPFGKEHTPDFILKDDGEFDAVAALKNYRYTSGQ